MSEANVETIRRAIAALAERDLDAVSAPMDPEVEIHGAVGGLEEGTCKRGSAAVLDALLPDDSIWAERRYEIQDLIDAGDRVVALLREHRRGRGSGIEVDADIALIYSFRGGKVWRIAPYLSQSEALTAAGVRK